MYVAGEMLKYDLHHSTPYLSIETYLPADIFHKVAQQIETGKAKKVRVNLECDVFQSEVERSLAEPWMRQEYTIDEESLNYCRLGSIAVGGTKYNPLPRESVEGDGERARAESVAPLEDDGGHRLQTMLLTELRRTNFSLKIIAWAVAVLALIVLLVRH